MEEESHKIFCPNYKIGKNNKEYPTHGVIGYNPPKWFDLGSLHRSPDSTVTTQNSRNGNYRRKKMDLEGSLNSCNSILCPRRNAAKDWNEFEIPDWNEGGKRTCEIYPATSGEKNDGDGKSELPDRFDNPSWFNKGHYGIGRKQHPFYSTSTSQYGQFPPNVHTMPRKYCPVKNAFSEHLVSTGMTRRQTLNIK